MDRIGLFQDILDSSQNTVFFGGAGVSTESGIPDFRSEDGLYRTKYSYPPEEILSASFFHARTREFYRFYRDKMLPLWAKPNAAHKKLAELEHAGKLSSVITQNIDGLHQAAGSEYVFELHGSIHRNFCMRCGKQYPASYLLETEDIPRCSCGGIVKPDVVLYGEPLDGAVVEGAIGAIERADTLIVAGTSLTVYPAAGFLSSFRGRHLVLINRSETALDGACELIFRENIGEVFSEIRV